MMGLRARYSLRAYPHVCGAAEAIGSDTGGGEGLPPRVWGSLAPDVAYSTRYRPTPTCVGQPDRCCGAVGGGWAYPHVCGAAHVAGLSG